ncbi:MAG: serine/threonine-protein kinase, partial [Aeromicrobium sp.]
MPETLTNRYTLDEVVGTGGMGSVYRAIDTRLGRTVAIKVLRDGTDADEVNRARMRSEAHLAASIHHPGVAQVFDFEDDDASGGGSTFIVMQFVEGHSLAQLLKQNGPMSADQVMSVVQQVAEGLQAAHDAGIVHRDLKPANIMLTPAGRTVLVDFGIARTDASDPLTDTGSLVGTTDYVSPEQVQGRSATAQSDLYALGIVAFHCLTGSSPFRRETQIATAMAHLHDDLPELGSEVPEDVAGLIASLTAKDPQERPATAADVAHEAARIGAAASIDLPP